MKKKFWKRVLGMTLVSTMLLTAPAAYAAQSVGQKNDNDTASSSYILVDDTVTDAAKKNYFTYHGEMDPDPNSHGGKGWVSNTKEGKWSSNEVATQHWIWDKDTNKAEKFTYEFTFVGTGVELIGIKSDATMRFQLDDGKEETVSIPGEKKTEVVLYKKDGLENKKHTVKVRMGKDGNGLQVSCAKVYGKPAIDGSIVDIDTQYTEDRYQEIRDMKKVKTGAVTAWKNDKAISSIALISKDSALKNVTVTASDLVSKNNKIPSKHVVPTFIKSTLAYDGPFLGYGSNRPNEPIPEVTPTNRKESADILYQTTPVDMGWNEVQAVWLEFNIPADAAAGAYTTKITVTADGIKEPLTFDYTVNVQNAVLPNADTFKDRFSIEFWHHPYASAEYYDVKPFSAEHLKILESMQDIYKEIGGNTIYTSIVEEPWMGQTWSSHNTEEQPTYPSMVKWIKDSKGNFTFDYTHFDTWVQFNIDRGLGDKIVMFSIAPWHNSFKYYDKDTGKLKTETFKDLGGVGSEKYNEIWTIFLKDLVKHLEQKGWFDRAYIGIDERGFDAKAFDIVESVKNTKGECLKIMGYMDNVADKNKYELALRCTDYSIGDNAAQTGHPEEYKKLLAERNAKGLKTTFYSCTEHRPGNFSLSQPVESYFSVIGTGKGGATGFARWAYDAWVPNPLEDATHSSFEPGDCFVIYPDLKSNKDHAVAKYSVRLARMAEGVRDMNKIMLMVEKHPELQSKVDALYDTVKMKAFTENKRYLNDEEISALRTQMNAFKTGLAELTEEYIRLENGSVSGDASGNSSSKPKA